MKTIKIDTVEHVLPILSVAQYGTYLEASEMIELDADEMDYKAQDMYWLMYDNSLYNKALLEYAQGYIDDNVLDDLKGLNIGIQSITVDRIESPRAYNYTNDKLEFTITADENIKYELLRFLAENPRSISLRDFMRKNYGSYDGYCSFMTSTIEGLIEDLKNDKLDAMAQVIHYLAKDFIEYNQMEFISYIQDNGGMFYQEFISEKDKKKLASCIKLEGKGNLPFKAPLRAVDTNLIPTYQNSIKVDTRHL